MEAVNRSNLKRYIKTDLGGLKKTTRTKVRIVCYSAEFLVNLLLLSETETSATENLLGRDLS
jgi:hypothetical protein